MSFQAERSYKSKKDDKKQEQEQKPKIKYEQLPRLPYDRALVAHKEAMDRGAKCAECPLFGLRAGPVMGDIVPNARLIIIGEAPGQNEIDQKRSFCGKSGEILNAALLDGGVAREECTSTNALLCRPPEELKAFEYRLKVMHEAACERAKVAGAPEPPPPVYPYECCFPRLQKDVVESGTKTVLAIGGAALRAVADVWDVPYGSSRKVQAGEVRISSLKKQIGSPITMPDGTLVVASYHPAFAMRPGSRHYMHVIKKHITRAAEIARRGRIDWVEPEYILNPSVETIERVLRSMKGRRKTIDIETDKGKSVSGEFDPFSCRIRCIGFGAHLNGEKGPETIIAVPIRYMSGAEWWPDLADKKRVIQACMDALNDESEDPETGEPAMLVGHNLAFDTSVLLRFKLLVRRDRLYDDCHVDSETEFLTSRGWLRYDDVDASDKLASFDKSGRLEWHSYTARVKKPLTCAAYVFETQRMRCVVTGNHWMWAQPEWRSNGRRDQWGLQQAETLLTSTPDTHVMLSAFTPDETRAESIEVDGITVTEDFCRLLGLVISDGCVAHDSAGVPRALRISQEVDGRATPLLRHLQSVFGLTKTSSTHVEEWRTTPKVEEAWCLGNTNIAKLVVKWTGRYAANKHLPPFALTMASNLKRALLAGLMAGDGSKPRTAELYRSSSRRLADEVQALVLSLGISALVYLDCECWAVSMRPDLDNTTRIVTRLGGRRAYGKVTKETFKNDFTVCFTVPPHNTLVTRSKNKPAFAGNTMLLHHDTPDNDLPHDLGFVGARYFEVPSWKSGADDKYYAEVTDHDLHLYNCRDVLTTMRLYYVLVDEIYRWATVDQYLLDRRMAPVARDMGELGLFIDEVKRGELSLRMNAEAYSRLLKLKELTGDPKFNPSSAPQIRKFLFVTKKHTPVINTRGKDWEDGEDPSTNTTALTKLVAQQSCDKHTKDFVNTLLEYRAYMKLKGTYIDKLRVHYPDWKREFGMDIPMLPEVRGPVWKKYTKWKKKRSNDDPVNWVEPPSKEAVAEERWPAEWAMALQKVPKGLPKAERQKASRERTARINAILDRVEEGIWEEAVVIPARPALSRLHTTYKLHVIPSGRMSTSPAVQNWPKFGKANMHEMIIAPPGHVMVGADLDQVELRLYAAIAGDKLLIDAFTKPGPDGKPFDPHSLNAASLFAKKFGKTIIETYLYIMGLPDMHAGLYAKAAIDQAVKDGAPLGVASSAIDAALVKRFNAAVKVHTDLSGNFNVAAAATDLALPAKLVEALAAGSKKGDKEKKKLRGYAKTFAYLETYGGEAEKLYGFMSTARDKGTGALMFPDLKEEDVQEWHKEWHKNHPETKAWQEACQRIARLEGFTAAPLGSYRKRYFMGGPNKPGATFNHVIQGAAAEIANAALLKIAKKIPYLKWSPFTGSCLQVHDYIGVYVPKEYGELAKQIIEEALNGEISNGIKITASAVISEGLATQ